MSTTVWAQLVDANLADAVCDSIIRSQPVPEKLLRVLATTPVQPETVEPSAESPVRLRGQRHRGMTLSATETEALEDAACGLTAEQSAQKRRRPLETIKMQRKQVLRKLGAVNMAHAIALSVRDMAA